MGHEELIANIANILTTENHISPCQCERFYYYTSIGMFV